MRKVLRKKGMSWSLLLASLTALSVTGSRVRAESLDAAYWVGGGRATSWRAGDPGQWVGSVVLNEGSLVKLALAGPDTAASYGFVGWVRPRYNYNDGRQYMMNFDWMVDVTEAHGNYVYVQITDGDNIPTYPQAPWVGGPEWFIDGYSPGTENLLWTGSVPHREYTQDSGNQQWSIAIFPAGLARLYDGPDGSGNLLGERMLDPQRAWYPRFMLYDATSAGFGPGASEVIIDSFSVVPEPTTLAMLAAGGVGLAAIQLQRRRNRAKGPRA